VRVRAGGVRLASLHCRRWRHPHTHSQRAALERVASGSVDAHTLGGTACVCCARGQPRKPQAVPAPPSLAAVHSELSAHSQKRSRMYYCMVRRQAERAHPPTRLTRLLRCCDLGPDPAPHCRAGGAMEAPWRLLQPAGAQPDALSLHTVAVDFDSLLWQLPASVCELDFLLAPHAPLLGGGHGEEAADRAARHSGMRESGAQQREDEDAGALRHALQRCRQGASDAPPRTQAPFGARSGRAPTWTTPSHPSPPSSRRRRTRRRWPSPWRTRAR
jgi:hypothetical protein